MALDQGLIQAVFEDTHTHTHNSNGVIFDYKDVELFQYKKKALILGGNYNIGQLPSEEISL